LTAAGKQLTLVEVGNAIPPLPALKMDWISDPASALL